METKYKLGFGMGSLIDHGDGTVSYREAASFSSAFRVRVADVTGFAVSSRGKLLTRTLRILGNGTELASVQVGHGVAEVIEQWFRGHPHFSPQPIQPFETPQPPVSTSAADELVKLVQLRDAGVLTPEEFDRIKARLVG
jgi:hypothetical protein